MKSHLSLLLIIIFGGILTPSLASATVSLPVDTITTLSTSHKALQDPYVQKHCIPLTYGTDWTWSSENHVVALPTNKAKDKTLIQTWSLVPPTANILACDEEGFAVILQYLEVISAPAKAILDITRVTLTAVDTGSKQFLNFLGSMLVTMLSQDKYITNPIVQGTWPFIQGIANLGFIIALLYIAFATTLRLDSVTTSVQRLLPKLLIAALLVNFSLVIGGLLIDVSRVIMAVEVGMVGIGQTPGDPKVFVTELIKKTNAIEAQIKLIEDSIPAVAFGSLMVRLFENSVFLILLITGLGVIGINLFDTSLYLFYS